MTDKKSVPVAKSARVTILLDEKHRDGKSRVLSKLKKQGFTVDAEGNLEAIGVLVGSVPREKMDALKDIDGISNIEEERTDYTPQK